MIKINPNKRPRSRLMMMAAPRKSPAVAIIVTAASAPAKRVCLTPISKNRKVSAPLVVVTMVQVTENCPHDHRFVLSRCLINYLDARDPAIKCLCVVPTNRPLLPWSDRVCVRSSFRRPDDACQPQDMLFLAQWIPNFVVSVCCQGGLLIRMALMQQCLADVELCVTNLKRRCLCKDDLKTINRAWSQPMVDWMSWAASAETQDLIDGCNQQDIGPTAPWEKIFTFAHHRAKPGAKRTMVFDELTPLWYFLLKTHGYVTGAPHPYLAPWTVDNACLPRIQVLHPARVGSLNAHLAQQLTTTVKLSPGVFVSLIMGLAELCRVKLDAMRHCLNRLAPLVAELYQAGFQGPLIKAAQLWCRKAMEAKQAEVAAILSKDLPRLIFSL